MATSGYNDRTLSLVNLESAASSQSNSQVAKRRCVCRVGSCGGYFSMESLRYIVLVVLTGLLVVGTKADAGIEVQAEPESAEVVLDEKVELEASNAAAAAAAAALTLELDLLKSRVSALELTLEEKMRDINIKDNLIREREKVIEEKSQTITTLKNAVESLKRKGAGDAELQVAKAYARVSELEGQVEQLEESLRTQKRELNSLELQAREAEKKAEEQSSKYEKMENFVNEQWIRIQQTEQALQIAEATMLKAQAEVATKANDLMKAYGAWLPPWLVVRLAEFQASVASRWSEHGEPVLKLVVEKASEKATAAQGWAKPHIETVKLKWGPIVTKQWQQLMITIAPHAETVRSGIIRAYKTSRDSITPHLIKAREFAEPHVQTIRELSRPYVDKIATVAEPHIHKAKVILSPYTGQAAHVYRRALTSATTYHHKLQGSVREALKKHEFTTTLATRELVWFLASALLALPVIGVWLLFSSLFGTRKKPSKPVRSSRSGNAPRKTKRRHADKQNN